MVATAAAIVGFHVLQQAGIDLACVKVEGGQVIRVSQGSENYEVENKFESSMFNE